MVSSSSTLLINHANTAKKSGAPPRTRNKRATGNKHDTTIVSVKKANNTNIDDRQRRDLSSSSSSSSTATTTDMLNSDGDEKLIEKSESSENETNKALLAIVFKTTPTNSLASTSTATLAVKNGSFLPEIEDDDEIKHIIMQTLNEKLKDLSLPLKNAQPQQQQQEPQSIAMTQQNAKKKASDLSISSPSASVVSYSSSVDNTDAGANNNSDYDAQFLRNQLPSSYPTRQRHSQQPSSFNNKLSLPQSDPSRSKQENQDYINSFHVDDDDDDDDDNDQGSISIRDDSPLIGQSSRIDTIKSHQRALKNNLYNTFRATRKEETSTAVFCQYCNAGGDKQNLNNTSMATKASRQKTCQHNPSHVKDMAHRSASITSTQSNTSQHSHKSNSSTHHIVSPSTYHIFNSKMNDMPTTTTAVVTTSASMRYKNGACEDRVYAYDNFDCINENMHEVQRHFYGNYKGYNDGVYVNELDDEDRVRRASESIESSSDKTSGDHQDSDEMKYTSSLVEDGFIRMSSPVFFDNHHSHFVNASSSSSTTFHSTPRQQTNRSNEQRGYKRESCDSKTPPSHLASRQSAKVRINTKISHVQVPQYKEQTASVSRTHPQTSQHKRLPNVGSSPISFAKPEQNNYKLYNASQPHQQVTTSPSTLSSSSSNTVSFTKLQTKANQMAPTISSDLSSSLSASSSSASSSKEHTTNQSVAAINSTSYDGIIMHEHEASTELRQTMLQQQQQHNVDAWTLSDHEQTDDGACEDEFDDEDEDIELNRRPKFLSDINGEHRLFENDDNEEDGEDQDYGQYVDEDDVNVEDDEKSDENNDLKRLDDDEADELLLEDDLDFNRDEVPYEHDDDDDDDDDNDRDDDQDDIETQGDESDKEFVKRNATFLYPFTGKFSQPLVPNSVVAACKTGTSPNVLHDQELQHQLIKQRLTITNLTPINIVQSESSVDALLVKSCYNNQKQQLLQQKHFQQSQVTQSITTSTLSSTAFYTRELSSDHLDEFSLQRQEHQQILQQQTEPLRPVILGRQVEEFLQSNTSTSASSSPSSLNFDRDTKPVASSLMIECAQKPLFASQKSSICFDTTDGCESVLERIDNDKTSHEVTSRTVICSGGQTSNVAAAADLPFSNSNKPKVRFNIDINYEKEREWNRVNKIIGEANNAQKIEWTQEVEV